jgi:hypothetical protein
MDLTEGSETSAKLNLTPGKYPKENIQDSEHGKNLKTRILSKSQLVVRPQLAPHTEHSLPTSQRPITQMYVGLHEISSKERRVVSSWWTQTMKLIVALRKPFCQRS